MADSIDLINRDPHSMNSYIQVEFDDVLGEPIGAHSSDCVWFNSYRCFNFSRSCCYNTLTFLCGIFAACYWGCSFACVSFSSIWCWTPCLRMISIVFHPCKKILSICLGTFCGPCVETCGLFFSRIHVTNSGGPPPKSLDHFDGHQ